MQHETFRYQILVADAATGPLAAVNLYGGGDAAFFDVHVMPERTRAEFEIFLKILTDFLGENSERRDVPPPQGDTKQ